MRLGIPSGSKSAPETRHANAAARTWHSFPRHLAVPLVWIVIAASAAGAWQWKPIGTTGGPGRRAYSVVAWTGHELLVWGGLPFGIDTAWQNSGWRYDPGTDSWSPMSPTNAPSARQFPVGAWTGSKLVIWGGHKPAGSPDSLQTGASYDPATDT